MKFFRLASMVCYTLFLGTQFSIGIPEILGDVGRWVSLVVFAAAALNLPVNRRRMLRPRLQQAAILCMLCVWAASTIAAGAGAVSMLKLGVAAIQIVTLGLVLPNRLGAADWRQLFQIVWMGSIAVMGVSLIMGVRGVEGTLVSGRLGGLANPNSTGVAALVAGAGALAFLSGAVTRSHWKWAAAFGIAICGATLFWSGSRSASLGFLLSGVVWLFTEFRSGRPRTAVVGVCVVLGLAWLTWRSEEMQLAASAQYLRGTGLTASRDQVWDASIESWKMRPWLGWGYGMSGAEVELLRVGRAVSIRDGSGYLGVLESVGILGTAALALVLCTVLWRSAVQVLGRMSAVRASWAEYFALSVLLGLVVNAAGEPWMIGPGSLTHFVLWLCVGVLAGLPEAGRRKALPRTKSEAYSVRGFEPRIRKPQVGLRRIEPS